MIIKHLKNLVKFYVLTGVRFSRPVEKPLQVRKWYLFMYNNDSHLQRTKTQKHNKTTYIKGNFIFCLLVLFLLIWKETSKITYFILKRQRLYLTFFWCYIVHEFSCINHVASSFTVTW